MHSLKNAHMIICRHMLKAALLEPHRESIIPIGDRFFFFFFCVYIKSNHMDTISQSLPEPRNAHVALHPQYVLAFDKNKGFL